MTDTIDRAEIQIVVLYADPGAFQDYRRLGGADPGQLPDRDLVGASR